jgi:hypothetical protein
LVAFLKANDNGERWLLAVSGHQQASLYIIEEGVSVMPIGGFGGGTPTLGADADEIKARLTKLVDDGQIRFFQVAGGRGGFPGGFGRGRGAVGPQGPPGGFGPPAPQGGGGFGPPAPQGGGGVGGGPPMGFGRGNAAVSQWVLDRVEKGKAKKVERKLYAAVATPEPNPASRRPGRGFGMMGGGELYDLRPELGLRAPAP